MKRLTLFLCPTAALLAVLVCTLPASGQCRTFVRSTPYYHTPYVEKVVVEKQVAIAAVYLPLYSAVYLPQFAPGYVPQTAAGTPAPAATDPCADVRQKALLLEQRLNALERGQAAPPPARTAPMPPADPPEQGAAPAAGNGFAAFAAANCASCHSETAAQSKGKGFVLVNKGGLVELSPEATGKVIARLSVPDGKPGVMPPGNRLKAVERLEGIRLFVGE